MTKSRHRRNRKPHFSRRTQPGDLPGLVRVDPAAPRPRVHVITYGPDRLEEREVTDCGQLAQMLGQLPVTWVNVEGLGDAATIKQIGQIFHLHPLALEDVVNTHQRPKTEQYGGVVFIVARMIALNDRLESEQVSLFLGSNFVVTFLEDPGDAFDSVRQHLRHQQGRIRGAGTGYLAYALLDAVVDAYFPVVEEYGERLELLEDEVVAQPDRRMIAKAHQVKRDLRTLRRAVWPLREAINALSRDQSALVDDETRIYLRDCYDHTVQIIDLVETYRELDADLTDLYLSSLSNRLNQVMMVLTTIATVFMPLSFLAGLYGMNFDTSSPYNMPELRWRFGYFFALGLMAATAAAMLWLFRRRGWIGPRELHPAAPEEASPAANPPPPAA